MTRHLLIASVLVGCTGQIGDSAESSGGGSGELAPPSCTTRGPRMIRRLTNEQIHNTLRRAFADDAVPGGNVVTDPVVNGFRVDATQAVVRDLDAQLIMTYAETVADWAVTTKLGQLSSCQAMDAACVRTFVDALGARMFREPVAPAIAETYAKLFTAEASFADGARATIAAMIQSPLFLYRRELGTKQPDGSYALTPYEIASSLSYMLTSGPPDDDLLAAAAQGRLATRADLDREVARLLAEPASATTFGQFARDWLEVGDLPRRAKVDPTNQLTDEIRAQMLDETASLFVHVLRAKAPLGELFTSSSTFAGDALARYYGLPGTTRATGILGLGSVLARHALADTSSPVQRGVLVRKRLLCEELAPPPPNVEANLAAPTTAMTTRQRYEAHSQATACKSCHTRIDPVGFAFERFDAFGRRRDQDGGLPVDTHGELSGMSDGTIALDGLDSLSAYLARSTQVRECVTRYLSYFALGLDGCSESELRAEIASGDGSLQSIVAAIVHSSHFTSRAE
jgi:hypothetical protein